MMVYIHEYPNDPTEDEIWGPIDPITGERIGGGLADKERANRKPKANDILPMSDYIDKTDWSL